MEVRVDRGARGGRKSRSRVTESEGTDAGTRGEGSGAGPVHSRRAGKTHVAATATANRSSLSAVEKFIFNESRFKVLTKFLY